MPISGPARPLAIELFVGLQQILRRSQRRPAGFLRILGLGRKDRQHAVAHEFEDLAGIFLDMPADQLEMLIEKPDDLRGLIDLGQSREIAKVGQQDGGIDGTAHSSAGFAGKDARTRSSAGIDREDVARRLRHRHAVSRQSECRE